MKNSKFCDPKWDILMFELVQGQSNDSKSKKMFLENLSSNSEFREEFCDWIKSLRDPAFSWENHQSKERKAS